MRFVVSGHMFKSLTCFKLIFCEFVEFMVLKLLKLKIS